MDKKTLTIVAIVVAVCAIVAVFVVISNDNGGDEKKETRSVYFEPFKPTDKKYYVGEDEYPVVRSYLHANWGGVNTVLPYYFSDGFFFSDTCVYNEHMATAFLILEYAGMEFNITEHPRGYTGIQTLEYLGFKDIEINEDMKKVPGENTFGITVGTKVVKSADGKEKKVIVVLNRSNGYGLEYVSNVTLGLEGDAKGFADSAMIVYDFLCDYMERHDINGYEDDIGIYLTGYSRGSAVSNITAKMLVDEFDPSGKKICAYTYATPAGGTMDGIVEGSNYNCIHNIFDRRDLVAIVAPANMGFIHYGVDHFIPGPAAGEIQYVKIQIDGAGERKEIIQAIDNFDGWDAKIYESQERFEKVYKKYTGRTEAPFTFSIFTIFGDIPVEYEEGGSGTWIRECLYDLQKWSGQTREKYAGEEGLCLEKAFQDFIRAKRSTNMDLKEVVEGLVPGVAYILLSVDPSKTPTEEEISAFVDKAMDATIDLKFLTKYGINEDSAKYIVKFLLTFVYHDYLNTYNEYGVAGLFHFGNIKNSGETVLRYHDPFCMNARMIAEDSLYDDCLDD